MKHVPFLVGAVAIFGAAEAGAQEKAKPVEPTRATLKVSGMSCSACAETVERTARRMRGVIEIKAIQPSASAEVTYDAAVTTADEVAKFIAKHSPFKAEAPRKQ